MGDDFAGHGIGDEALFVGFVVEALQQLLARFVSVGEYDFRIEIDAGDRQLSGFVFGEVADGSVAVALNGEFAHRGDGEEGEHVAAGNGSDEGLLRIDLIGVAEVVGRGGGAHFDSVAEAPGVVARVAFVVESGVAAFPGESRYVFGHGGDFGGDLRKSEG